MHRFEISLFIYDILLLLSHCFTNCNLLSFVIFCEYLVMIIMQNQDNISLFLKSYLQSHMLIICVVFLIQNAEYRYIYSFFSRMQILHGSFITTIMRYFVNGISQVKRKRVHFFAFRAVLKIKVTHLGLRDFDPHPYPCF